MFRRMVIGALLLVALVAAPAAAQYDFTVSPGDVVPGGSVTVSGSGCQPGETVTITLTQVAATKAVGDSVVIATATTDANGAFTITFVVPEGTAVGSYTLTANCGGHQVGVGDLNVVAPGTATTTPGSTTPIVRTGSDLTPLGLVGAALITVGGIILIATRTRRHARA